MNGRRELWHVLATDAIHLGAMASSALRPDSSSTILPVFSHLEMMTWSYSVTSSLHLARVLWFSASLYCAASWRCEASADGTLRHQP